MARLCFECLDAEGHRVLFETSEKEGKELVASYGAYKLWLQESGFTLASAPSAKPASKQKVPFDGQHCPQCDGPVWDNRPQKREDPSRRRSPDFACKDKGGCKWAVWPGQYELVEQGH